MHNVAVGDRVVMPANIACGGCFMCARGLQRMLPDALARPMMRAMGVDQLSVLRSAIDVVRRGGTVSIAGVYGGMVDPLPLLTMFDKQLTLRMGQLNARRWLDDLMPLILDDTDPLGTERFATHRLPLAEAPTAYRNFAKKSDGTIKVLFTP